MKKFFALLLSLAMVLALVACGQKDPTPDTPDTPDDPQTKVEYKVAMITDYGDITDQSFNQTTYEACKAFAEDNSIEFSYFRPAGDNTADRVAMIEKAVDEGFNVIVMPGYAFGGAIVEAAPEFPDVKFIALDVAAGDEVVAVEVDDTFVVGVFYRQRRGQSPDGEVVLTVELAAGGQAVEERDLPLEREAVVGEEELQRREVLWHVAALGTEVGVCGQRVDIRGVHTDGLAQRGAGYGVAAGGGVCLPEREDVALLVGGGVVCLLRLLDGAVILACRDQKVAFERTQIGYLAQTHVGRVEHRDGRIGLLALLVEYGHDAVVVRIVGIHTYQAAEYGQGAVVISRDDQRLCVYAGVPAACGIRKVCAAGIFDGAGAILFEILRRHLVECGRELRIEGQLLLVEGACGGRVAVYRGALQPFGVSVCGAQRVGHRETRPQLLGQRVEAVARIVGVEGVGRDCVGGAVGLEGPLQVGLQARVDGILPARTFSLFTLLDGSVAVGVVVDGVGRR